jgi:glutamate synthase domain-containing protein 1
MEIIKDVCTVEELDKRFKVSSFNGTHGIGHVRFSTESRVDLFHAHPFQSFNYPDIAVVHNGQITNYYKMRDRLERRGHRFETENDSELIVHYVADKLENDLDLEEALKESAKDLDGPFSYIISMPDAIGVAKDKLGLRPALVLEGDGIFAIASEEVALRTLSHSGTIRNVKPGEVVTWRR